MPLPTRSPQVIGALCGVAAAVAWSAGLVAARHGVLIGFSPEDLAFHRFVWAGLFLLPIVWRAGLPQMAGIGWGRGLLICVLAGPVQAILSYTGFTLAPLGHGAVIHPGGAMLGGLLLAYFVLHEHLRTARVIGAVAMLAGLVLLSVEALATIGRHGFVGDLLFLSAGLFWAVFTTLLRLWNLPARTAAAVIGTLSLLVYGPIHAVFFGFDRMIAVGWWENLLQIAVQAIFAGTLAILLFARAVTLLGAGGASVFPGIVPAATVLIGFLTIGETPTLVQLLGLAIVAVGFRLAVKP
ncbi:MAG: hypothetical protein QOD74_1789 [Variibacter sp.]|jgi:drug/metabolite transporter (DMT)-like permease|nr:hypothetical protein [Variibacter sp.]